jgi:hypothetical protein
MANKAVTQLTAISTFASGDTLPAVDVSENELRKVTGTVLLAWLGASLDMSTIASGGALAVAYGGSGRATGTTAYSLVATGTTATGAQQTLANGATTTILVGGGASALPVWTTATGTGAPVRATTPTLVTPVIGVASATSLACPTFTTSSGAMGFTPAAGSNLNITLSTTGDFAVNTSQLYVDTSAARIGVGTTTPSAKIDINGIHTSITSANLGVAGSGTSTAEIALYRNAGGGAGATGYVGFYAKDSAGNVQQYARLAGHIVSPTSGSETGSLIFSTALNGTMLERMTLDENGSLGINELVPDYKLDVNGTFGFTPGTSVTPVDNGDIVFEFTSNTSIKIKGKGTDGTVRELAFTIA